MISNNRQTTAIRLSCITRYITTKTLYALVIALAFNGATFAEDQITLNLKDADIRALISTVSKFTGKNFIIDPRIKAKVTVVSAKTMGTDEVYQVFLSVLQVHGFAAVPVGSVIKIVPEVNAKQGPLPLIKGRSSHAGDQLITKIIRLDHVPAAQLVPILRPLVPQTGHLAAYAPTNTLIITDHAGNIQRLLNIIRGVDRPDNDELEVIPLKHASASELVRIMNSLKPKTAAKGGAQRLTLAADDRTNSILMTGERSARIKARTTIMHLDTPLEDGGNTHVIYLKYAKAENLVKILTGIKDKASSGRTKATSPAARAAGGGALAKNAIIQFDEDTNALIITADPNTLSSLRSVIRQLDIRRAQVLIEAIIAEISENKSKELGVGLVADGTANDSKIPAAISNFGGLSDVLLAAAGNGTSAASFSLGGGLTLGAGKTSSGGARYGLLLRALASNSASNILSTPSIVTLDNEEAEIIVGQNVPFVTGSSTGTSSTTANPFRTIERQDVGLTLKVTPQVNEGDTIKLEIEQETSSVVPSADISNGPTTRKRSIKTSVLIDDGGILILGGLIEESLNDTVSKVPILGDIPLLGWLFQSRVSTRDKQNLMVFIHPTILRERGDASFVTNEKYNLLRSMQLQAEEEEFGLINDKHPILPPLLPVKLEKAEAKADIPSKEFDWDSVYDDEESI